MDSNIQTALQGFGFTIENTGGGCDAWVKQFDGKRNPSVELSCDPYLMITQNGGADIEERDIDTCGLTLGYYEYSVDEKSHFYTTVEFLSFEGLLLLLVKMFSTDQPDFPDFDNWLAFELAARDLRQHGFHPDLERDDTMPCLSYQGAYSDEGFPRIEIWFNWYDSDLSEQDVKLYTVTHYSPKGEIILEQEFDNLEQTLTVARTLQILASS
jgi:hypothetical protein